MSQKPSARKKKRRKGKKISYYFINIWNLKKEIVYLLTIFLKKTGLNLQLTTGTTLIKGFREKTTRLLGAKVALQQGVSMIITKSSVIERFSFECRKVIGFGFATLRDWLRKLAPLFHPIRSKAKTNRDSLVRVYPHTASASCN